MANVIAYPRVPNTISTPLERKKEVEVGERGTIGKRTPNPPHSQHEYLWMWNELFLFDLTLHYKDCLSPGRLWAWFYVTGMYFVRPVSHMYRESMGSLFLQLPPHYFYSISLCTFTRLPLLPER